MPTHRIHRRESTRRGLAALEVVVTTAVMFPVLAYLLYFGIQVMRNYYSLAGSMMGSPY